ncbi:helix-turn-helix domain-containing protein [Kangiella koreensis]|uniref:Transcriptional regulator, AraC family n=1 Tax=Kangiella koreensis (strain DSM 16069 / JCM 12317 / KCTC 12182 / SW-125) TaxID=523791 RepID=C7R734_KANKD|nr:AraC family transcriptional regulator [Kangiella koreensis]ACV27490.1 transcriptional regulator, AraC family [Kangiella koreensis DSM 16069]
MNSYQLEAVNILQVIFIAVAGFGSLLIANQVRYRGLAYLLLGVSALMIFNLLEETKVNGYLISPIFSLANGPLFYLFVRQLVYPSPASPKQYILHLLPAIFAIPFTVWPQAVLLVGTLSQVIYLTQSVKLVQRYHKANQAMRSDAYTTQLKWLSRLLISVIIIAIVDLARVNLQPYLHIELLKVWYLVMQLVYFTLICTLIFKAIRQPETFHALSEFDQMATSEGNQTNNNDQAQSLFNQINQLIKEHQYYLQPRLSLKDLHQYLGINEKDLSWAINKGSQKSFCDYINHLRIQHFKQLTQGNFNSNILEMALDSGFSSKSSFNAVFKKHTGKTPSQYISNSINL